MCHEKPKCCDRYLPALIFAYREVRKSSLVFSPFELIYMRNATLCRNGTKGVKMASTPGTCNVQEYEAAQFRKVTLKFTKRGSIYTNKMARDFICGGRVYGIGDNRGISEEIISGES